MRNVTIFAVLKLKNYGGFQQPGGKEAQYAQVYG